VIGKNEKPFGNSVVIGVHDKPCKKTLGSQMGKKDGIQ
jgi:hypothetical protein